MIVERMLSADVAAGTGPALLAALARAAAAPEERHRDLGDALDAVGDTTGELWLNLLGVPLDAGPPYTAERLLEAAAALDPVELRRHVLGRHAWSWCALAGLETIEAAARGDLRAVAPLLTHTRYYGGRAADTLAVVLPLDPGETRRRIVDALEAGARRLVVDTDAEALAAAGRTAADAVASLPPLEAIARVAGGYRYVPEPEADRVVLVPHLEPTPALVLAQHRGARLVVYAVPAAASPVERLAALGRALADPRRVEILSLIAAGVGRGPELAARTGLARSTAHHHLALLREAGLVTLAGNARGYAYVVRGEAVQEAAALLAELAP